MGLWIRGRGHLVRVVAIGVVATVVMLVAFRVSVAGVFREANPTFGRAVAPNDAGAGASQAALILSTARDQRSRELARELATQTLQRDPTSVVAFRTLALVADASGDTRQAVRLFSISQRMSYRDRLTHIWLIGEFQRRGDIANMVRQFDLAMRTSRRSWEALLPILATATADRRSVAPLRALLVSKPDWWLSFSETLASRAPDPQTAVALTNGLLDPAIPQERRILVALIARSIDEEQFPLAWHVYAQARRRLDAPISGALLRNGDFEAVDDFPPIDWALQSDPELTAIREPRPDSGSGTILSLVAADGRTGEVARQLLLLSPGSYRFRVEAGAIPSGPIDRPQFVITCADRADGQQLLEIRPQNAGQSIVSGRFSVPNACPAQWISVRLSGQGQPPEIRPWIDNLTIARDAG